MSTMKLIIILALSCSLLAFNSVALSAETTETKSQTTAVEKTDKIKQLQSMYFNAARTGDIDLLKQFYQSGLSPNIANEKGYTALILSAYNGQDKTVDYLLGLTRVNACQEDKRGNTALMGAIFKGNLSIASSLISADCQVDQTNNNGQTALMFATLFDRREILAALVANGADKNITDNSGTNAVKVALSQGNTELAVQLQEGNY